MKLQDIISIDKKFQTSVNLEYDLDNLDKVVGYIPTEQSVKIIDRFLRGIYYQNVGSHANVLVGPYGRGKSHLLLVLSAILSLDVVTDDKKKAKRILQELTKKIYRVSEETGALVDGIIESEIRLLPVIINSNSIDINQSLIIALKSALERANISNLLPATHFDAALEIFDMWANTYPDAFKKFSEELNNKKIEISDFRVKLAQYDIDAYNTFCEIYPLVAAGTKFNPYANTDVIKLYSSVNQELINKTAYRGMFIVFDEFSKFVEANLDKSKMNNFKIIQDLAELAEREKTPQMHFTCVTHKSLLDYSASDSFKTVEGRFGTINFVSTSEQSYELIANAIIKKDCFKQFRKEHSLEFSELDKVSWGTGVFGDIEENSFNSKLVVGCFPIAPLTAYSLLRVSEKVGQNERTIFTFIAQNDKGTLANFIKTESDFNLMTVDYVFDYFQDLFKKSLFNETVHSMWAKANSALYQVDDENAKKIVKVIAIIGIIGDEKFRPISTHIKAALNYNEESFNYGINKLLSKKIVAQRESSEYVLLTANGVDVQNNVNDYVATKVVKFNPCSLLDSLISPYILPRQYNDEYSMIRYFKVRFISANEFIHTQNLKQLENDNYSDGLILNVLPDKEIEYESIVKQIQKFKNEPQIIVCTPSNCETFDDSIAKQLFAAREIKKTDIAKADKHYFEELEVFEEDARKRLLRQIEDLYDPESIHSHFYNCSGELEDIRKQVSLNRAVSKICLARYDLSPKINNEMVNKNRISTPIRKARSIVVNHILDSADENEISNIVGLGPEVSIFGSVFEATGLSHTVEIEDPGLKQIVEKIDEFIKLSEKKKQPFSCIYNLLLAAPYGVRKGIIPMLLAYVLRRYRENVVVYYGINEVELNAEVLDAINETNGEKYCLLLEKGTKIKDKVINDLYTIFSDYSEAQNASINKTYTVVKNMQTWMRSLPEFTKKCSGIYQEGKLIYFTEKEKLFRKELLKFEINSREFLFEKIFEELTEEGCSSTFDWIISLKAKFDNQIDCAKKYIRNITKEMFLPKYNGSLSTAIMSWKNSLSDKTIKHMFDGVNNQLLTYILSIHDCDDEKIIVSLANIISSVNILDWNDDTVERYTKILGLFIETINLYNANADNTLEENGIEVTVNGTKISKTFSNTQASSMGQALKNNLESSMEEFGESVSSDEKLNILLALIKDLIR